MKKTAVKRKTKKNATALVVAETPKLVMQNTFIQQNQLLHLVQRTPAQHIYQRPAKGGGTWDYVTGVYVQKVLNYVFGWNWDFEVKEHGREGKLVWVLGRLIIRDKDGNVRIVKEQFGRADIKSRRDSNEALDFGNDLKAATTDALKKCASLIGVASDIYGKNEFKDIGKVVSPAKVQEEVIEKAPAPAPQPKNGTQVNQLKALLHKEGANDEKEALAMILEITGQKVATFKTLSEGRAKVILASLLNK